MTAAPGIRITPEAATKIGEYAAANGRQTPANLRIELIGGAESGFAYDLFFDECQPDDCTVEADGVCVLVRPELEPYLRGTVIDWVSGDNGAGFQLQNPNEPEH